MQLVHQIQTHILTPREISSRRFFSAKTVSKINPLHAHAASAFFYPLTAGFFVSMRETRGLADKELLAALLNTLAIILYSAGPGAPGLVDMAREYWGILGSVRERAVEVNVRPCFLVKVRKASGRRVAGGRMMGRTTDLEGTGGLKGLSGCAGVANAGEEEGIPLEGGRFFGAKKGGAGGFARRGSLSGRSSGFWGVL